MRYSGQTSCTLDARINEIIQVSTGKHPQLKSTAPHLPYKLYCGWGWHWTAMLSPSSWTHVRAGPQKLKCSALNFIFDCVIKVQHEYMMKMHIKICINDFVYLWVKKCSCVHKIKSILLLLFKFEILHFKLNFYISLLVHVLSGDQNSPHCNKEINEFECMWIFAYMLNRAFPPSKCFDHVLPVDRLLMCHNLDIPNPPLFGECDLVRWD